MRYYFDLDNTLIDTRELRVYRRNVEGRRWIAEQPNSPRFSTRLVNPKIVDLIRSLGDKVSVITNSPEDYARALLRKHRFPELPLMASAEKPCTKFSLPRDSVYIGDEPRDALYGHEQRIPSIAYVEGGFFPEKSMDKSLPSATAKSISELEALLSEKLEDEPRDLSNFTILASEPSEDIPIHFIQDYCPSSRDKSLFKKTNSGNILTYKRCKDCTWQEIEGGLRDSFAYKTEKQRAVGNGPRFRDIVNGFYSRILGKIESLKLSGSVQIIALPNSLPEFAYLCDVNYRIAFAFNQKNGRTLYRVRPVKEAHNTGVRSARKHIGTLAIHKNPNMDFNVDNIILFDDIITTGTQLRCAAALLRMQGYKGNIAGLALGKTIEESSDAF